MQFQYVKEADSLLFKEEVEQYRQLVTTHGTEALQSECLKNNGRAIIPLVHLLLALSSDNEKKVLAGLAIDPYPEYSRGELPASLARGSSAAHVMGVVADPAHAAEMPGLKLQENLLTRLKEGALDATVLTGYVLQQNGWALHEAAAKAGVNFVVRRDLTRETDEGRSFFVAAAADPKINLVPKGHEQDVISEGELKQLASTELQKFKKAKKERRNPLKSDGTGHSIADEGCGVL